MRINYRLTSFGYDTDNKTFIIKTTDPNYLKMLLAENPIPEEIILELNENGVRQICQYFSLWKKNQTEPLPQENLR